ELVATAGVVLFCDEQLPPRRKPLLTCSGPIFRHRLLPSYGLDRGMNGGTHRVHIVLRPGAAPGASTTGSPSPTIASASGTSIDVRGGRTFCATTTTPTTDIHATLITPSAINITINPMLEPTQYVPNCKPERTVSRQS